jgi:hypothetical protein
MIIEYRFILGEIAKTGSSPFISALIHILEEEEEEAAKAAREHHDLLFLDILAIALQELNLYDHAPILSQCCHCLITHYRQSPSLKLRQTSIETLTLIDQHILGRTLQQEEAELVTAYRQKMSEDESQSQYF